MEGYMSSTRMGGAAALATAASMLILAATALANRWDFGWSGWHGGSKDSRTWVASRVGTHSWYKETCHSDGYQTPGGTFVVELRRVRSFAPDVSLGTHQFNCNNTNGYHTYSSDGSGEHKFRFPSVSQGYIGISGTGHVNYP